MSKASNCKRAKLITNIFASNLSGTDKMIYYAMHLKYIDGEQLLEYIQAENPSVDDIREYIEVRLRENRVRKNG